MNGETAAWCVGRIVCVHGIKVYVDTHINKFFVKDTHYGKWPRENVGGLVS